MYFSGDTAFLILSSWNIKHFPGPGVRGIFHPQGWLGLPVGFIEKFIILYIFFYYSCYKLYFGIKMCTIKFQYR